MTDMTGQTVQVTKFLPMPSSRDPRMRYLCVQYTGIELKRFFFKVFADDFKRLKKDSDVWFENEGGKRYNSLNGLPLDGTRVAMFRVVSKNNIRFKE